MSRIENDYLIGRTNWGGAGEKIRRNVARPAWVIEAATAAEAVAEAAGRVREELGGEAYAGVVTVTLTAWRYNQSTDETYTEDSASADVGVIA